MASYLETLKTEVRAAIEAVWADVSATEVYETYQAGRIPIDAQSMPYAVFEMDRTVRANYGMAIEAYEVQVTCMYVAAGQGDAAAVRAKAEAMRDYLFSTGLSSVQVLDIDLLDWSEAQASVAQFMARSELIDVASVTFTAIVGET